MPTATNNSLKFLAQAFSVASPGEATEKACAKNFSELVVAVGIYISDYLSLFVYTSFVTVTKPSGPWSAEPETNNL